VRAGLAPKLITSPEYAGIANYAYHLDAVKLGELLASHATQKLGVRHIDDEIVGVERAEDGDVRAVIGQRSGPIAADLFVDCTGFAARLLGEALEVPFIDRSDVLFIDRALAVQLPVEPTARLPLTPFPPRRSMAGSGISACRRGAASAMSIPVATPAPIAPRRNWPPMSAPVSPA
jgi:glycine/D-amino acid oxidase-like deaminating enzyme